MKGGQKRLRPPEGGLSEGPDVMPAATKGAELEELHLALTQCIEQRRGEGLHIAVETELLAE